MSDPIPSPGRPPTPVTPATALPAFPSPDMTSSGAAGDGRRSLDRSLVHGIAWTGGIKWAAQAVGWASTLVVARLLTPADYGVISMATVYLGLVTLLSEFGVGTAVVMMRELSDDDTARVAGFSLLVGVLSLLMSLAVAIPIGWLYDEPALPPVVAVMSTTFAITAFRAVPMARMQRDMQFRQLALIDGAQALAFAVVTLVLAATGWRYWSLVGGAVVAAVVSTIAIVASRPQAIRRPSFHAIRAVIAFSGEMMVGRLAWYVSNSADLFVGGKVLGKSPLGAYSFGRTLSVIPLEKIAAMIFSVTPAILSAVQKDIAALRRYVLLITEGLALATFPMTIGLALVGPELVRTVLGPQWLAMILPMQILACAAMLRSVTPILSQVLVATHQTRYLMNVNIGAAIALTIGFYVGSHWGITGIAVAWLAVHPIVASAPLLTRSLATLELRPARYLRALMPAITGTIAMVIGVTVVRRLLPIELHDVARLVLLIASGAVIYGASVILLHRSRLQEMLSALRLLRG
ncbi:MAG TPA: oligosaccharide flippase family protein [Gemmatimonadaceae bacterium]|nr:oligosaccharide flippase family protein [Gemmatimonadaceae bacterium]